jgi:hypothetical protein
VTEQKKRAALRRTCLHELLDQEETSSPPRVLSGEHRANVAHEMAERVAQRLASRKPFRSPGKELLSDYRSME